MLLKLSLISIVLFMSRSLASAQNQLCSSFTSGHVQLDNKIVEFEVSQSGLTCQCRAVDSSCSAAYGDDYTYTTGIGAHKFHNLGRTWNEARKVCIEEGGHLAILNSKREEEVLRAMFQSQVETVAGDITYNETAWLGVHNLFDNNDWVTVLGDSINSVGFEGWGKDPRWGPAQPSEPAERHCGALIRKYGMMSDDNCSWSLPFFCEKPEICL